MGKSVAYFMKWAKFLPISRNGQFRGLGVTYTLFTYLQISSRSRFIGESAEQPLQDPNGRALNQPRPHPSDKIV